MKGAKHTFKMICGQSCALVIGIYSLFLSCPANSQSVIDPTKPLFELLNNDLTGIRFANMVADSGGLDPLSYVYAYNGGGVAVGDLDNDGLQDVVFTSNQQGASLYKNKGQLKFVDKTNASGVAFAGGWYTGVTLADVNDDGLLDIYLCRSGRDTANRSNLLYINLGNFHFKEESSKFRLDDGHPSTHANFFDFDLDGDLDVYIVNHPTEFENIYLFNAYTDSNLFHLGADRLLRNDGGSFVDVTNTAGISPSYAFGLSASVADINNDGYPDVYVANDFFSPDRVYINNKNGSFIDRTSQYLRQCPLFSMGSDFADLNNDGFLDMMVVDMMPNDHARIKSSIPTFPMEYVKRLHSLFDPKQYVTNVLNLSEGGEYFTPIQEMAGVARTDWSWGVLLADFNNDGLNDIYTVNGTKRDYFNLDFNTLQRTVDNDLPYRHYPDSLLKHMPVTKLRNHLFLNNGDLKFSDESEIAGMKHRVISSGIAFGDLDNDGDLDIVQNNTDTVAFVYRNLASENEYGNYLRVKLIGPKRNQFAIGSRAYCYANGVEHMTEVRPVRGFQSSSETIIHFGLKKGEVPDSLIIRWPRGESQLVLKPDVNKLISIDYNPTPRNYQTSKQTKALLTRSNIKGLQYNHIEDVFSDFKRERLLPFKLSNEGPSAVVFDMNNDGKDDVFFGGAYNGSRCKLFIQNEGEFNVLTSQPWDDLNLEVTGAVAVDVNSDGFYDLIVTTGSNEMSPSDETLHPHLFINQAGTGFAMAHWGLHALKGFVSSSPLTIDYNGDGLPDLLLFSRMVPSKYPEGGRSYLLKNAGDHFEDVTNDVFPGLLTASRVASACVTDMNEDGTKDVVIASEWEPLKLFAWMGSGFKQVPMGAQIDSVRGLWKSLYSTDLNNDGKPEILVGNQGQNSWLKANASEPLKLYYGDVDRNGTSETLLTHYLNGVEGMLHDRNTICEQMPSFRKKFHSYTDYAQNAISKILTSQTLSSLRQFSANYLSSFIVSAKGSDRFEICQMPREIQSGPVYDWLVDDVNGDGEMDILAVGGSDADYYQLPNSLGRKGYFLRGIGGLEFEYVNGVESGFICPDFGRRAEKVNIAGKVAYVVISSNGPVVIFRPNQ